ncbi:MAG: hypothetical protein KKE20_07015 [Nanoarchaeota archaeon]|nr:hypothetical protein [Nanoarchaeota archaeon]
MKKKSQIWISAVLYVLLISIVIVIVLEGGTPILENLRDKSVFIQTRDNFVALDKNVMDVSNAGPGSQRIVPFEIKKGELTLGNSQLKWQMDTKSPVIQPRTSIDLGNLRLGSDSDVDAYESNDQLILENYYIKAVFSKIGNESDYGSVNSTSIIQYLTYNRNNGTASGSFSFMIDDNSIDSDGYSKIVQPGYDLGSATVMFYINQTDGVLHTLYFTLDSRSDYLKVDLI